VLGERVSGDEYVAQEFSGGFLLAAIDGLGHGEEAHAAASAAAEILTTQAGQAIDMIVRECHEALRGTRGVAISVASIDVARHRMTWMGIGNVEGVLLRAEVSEERERERLLLRNGIVDRQLPTLRTKEVPVHRNDLLVFATDGIRSDFLHDLRAEGDVGELADRILTDYQRSADDALALVASIGKGTMQASYDRLTEEYGSAFRDYFRSHDEAALMRAYDLGRQALEVGLGTLYLVTIHQEALIAVLAETASPEERDSIIAVASNFLTESLASFEMVHRGFEDTNRKLQEANAALEEKIDQLQASEARSGALIESTHDAIVISDHQGNVVLWNTGAEEIFGHTEEEILGQSVSLIMPEQYRPASRRGMERVNSGEAPRIMGQLVELEGLRKDGVRFPLEMSLASWQVGEEVYHSAIIRDVTARKEAQQRLLSERGELLALMDAIPFPVYLKDMDGRYLHVNQAKADAMKLNTTQAAVGRTRQELRPDHPETQYDHEEDLRIARDGERIVEQLDENAREGKPTLWTLDTKLPISDETGHKIGMIGVSQDITERKRDQDQLEQANQRLEEALEELRSSQQQILQQERLRALGQMASGIAHDFNNALSPILGFSDLLLMRPENLEDITKTTRYLELIHTAAQDAGNIVARMREFYRQREEGDLLTTVDLDAVINEAISLTQPKWKDEAQADGRDVRVTADVRGAPSILGNPSELREVLTNLVFNACDAMPEGGTVTLRAYVDANHVILEVADTGIGMPPDVRRQCLDPFFTTKEAHGTGMGLAMVYGIVQRHNGVLDIESEEGEGTTFILRFPVPEEERVEHKASVEKESRETLRVLVVEDEALVREVIVAYLDANGHEVEEAEDGAQALAVFSPGDFDLVITDRAMPGMSGDQVAEEIKERSPDTPILMLTGFGALMGNRPKGVDAVVAKPITMGELIQAISALTDPSDAEEGE
jgi:PAS domain S-box-containing protein